MLALVVALQGVVSVGLLLLYLSAHVSAPAARGFVGPVRGDLSVSERLEQIRGEFELGRVLVYEVLANNLTSYRPPFLMLCHEPGEWICDRLLSHKQYEAQLFDNSLFAWAQHYTRSELLFVDLGANMGLWSVFFAAHGVRTLSVEPSPRNFARLRANAALNDVAELVEAHRVAVSDHNGSLHIAYYDYNSGIARLRDTPERNDTPVELVTVDYFATLRAHCAAGRPVLAKIDVEGAEMALLRGALSLLRSGCVRSFFIELLTHFHPVGEILGVGLLLRSCGYTLHSPHTDQWWQLWPDRVTPAERRQAAALGARLLCVEAAAAPKWQPTPFCSDATQLTEAELNETAAALKYSPEEARGKGSLAAELAHHILYEEWRHLKL